MSTPAPTGSGPRGFARRWTDAGLLAVARWIALGVICLPFLVPRLPANLGPADIPIFAAMVTFVVWAGSTAEVLRGPYLLPLAIIMVTGTIAALAGQFPAQGGVAVGQDLYLLLWGVTVANAVRRPEAMRIVTGAWVASSTIAALVLVGAVVTRQWGIAGVGSGSSRAAFTFGEQNGAAMYFVVSLMVVLATRRPSNPVVRGLVVVLMAAAMVATGSLAGLLGLAAGVAVAAVILVRERWGYPVAIAALFGIVLAGGLLVEFVNSSHFVDRVKASPNVYVRNSVGREEQSKSEREVLARETSRLYFSGSLLGRGPASTEYVLDSEQAPYPKEAHNDYIAALVERGPIGLVGVLLLAGAVAARAVSVSRRDDLADGFRDVVRTPAFLAGALVAVVVFSLTHETLHDRTVWTLFGLVAGLHAWARRPSAERSR